LSTKIDTGDQTFLLSGKHYVLGSSEGNWLYVLRKIVLYFNYRDVIVAFCCRNLLLKEGKGKVLPRTGHEDPVGE